MKTSEILKMDVKGFENLLSEENWEYASERYVTINNALQTYQEGAESAGEDEYLDPNTYFELDKEQDEEIEE